MKTEFNIKNVKDTAPKVILAIFVIWIIVARFSNPGLNPVVHTSVITDEGRVNNIASNFATYGDFAFSEGFSEDERTLSHAFWTGPLTVSALASVFFLFGSGYVQERILVGIMSILVVVLIFMLTKKVCDRRRAIAAAVIVGVQPIMVFYGRVALHDMLSFVFMILAIYATLSAEGPLRKRFPWLFAVGAFAALSFFSKYSGILVILVIIVFYAWARRRQLLYDIPAILLSALAVGGGVLLWISSLGERSLEAFFLTINTDSLATGLVSNMTAIDSTAAFIGETARTLIFYYPFVMLVCVIGTAIFIKQRGIPKPSTEWKMIIAWIAVGFFWWIQSASTGKYSLIFGIPLFILAGKFIVDMYGNRKFMPLAAIIIVLAVSFYAAVDYSTVADFRDASIYDMAAKMSSLDERVFFAESEIAFASGKSMVPFYWIDSLMPRWFPKEHFDKFRSFYSVNTSLSMEEYMKEVQPSYILLSDITKNIGTTPRKDLRDVASIYGTVAYKAGPYTLYAIDWDSPRDEPYLEPPIEVQSGDIISLFKSLIGSR